MLKISFGNFATCPTIEAIQLVEHKLLTLYPSIQAEIAAIAPQISSCWEIRLEHACSEHSNRLEPRLNLATAGEKACAASFFACGGPICPAIPQTLPHLRDGEMKLVKLQYSKDPYKNNLSFFFSRAGGGAARSRKKETIIFVRVLSFCKSH
jgi:hypothetical protein